MRTFMLLVEALSNMEMRPDVLSVMRVATYTSNDLFELYILQTADFQIFVSSKLRRGVFNMSR